jgi:hypothetical protein
MHVEVGVKRVSVGSFSSLYKPMSSSNPRGIFPKVSYYDLRNSTGDSVNAFPSLKMF